MQPLPVSRSINSHHGPWMHWRNSSPSKEGSERRDIEVFIRSMLQSGLHKKCSVDKAPGKKRRRSSRVDGVVQGRGLARWTRKWSVGRLQKDANARSVKDGGEGVQERSHGFTPYVCECRFREARNNLSRGERRTEVSPRTGRNMRICPCLSLYAFMPSKHCSP